MNIDKEIFEIGRLINSVSILSMVRDEVSKIREGGFIVTDGKRVGRDKFEVVVKCSGEDEVVRRLRGSMPEADIQKLADGVLGINASRRGRNVNV